MGFLTSLFGGETNIWTIGFALIIVIVLIVVGVWLLKLLFNMSGTMARGRQRRLSIVDTMAIDAKHNLVIVRHDNTEHLLVLSNSTATLVQANILAQDTISVPKSVPATPNVTANTTAIIAGSAAIAGAGVASAPNNDVPPQTKQRFGISRLLQRKSKPESEEIVVNTAKVDAPIANAPEVKAQNQPEPKNQNSNKLDEVKPQEIHGTSHPSSIAQLRPIMKEQPQKLGPSLRHTGLLVPISEMVTANRTGTFSANDDKNTPSDADSAMNEAKRVDSKAMESIEESTVPSNDAGKAKRGKTKAKSTKKSS